MVEVTANRRKGTERREIYRRSRVDNRIQQTEVPIERRSGKDRRTEE